MNRLILSKASKLIFVIIALIATPIHEFGHFLGFQLSGIPAKFSFNATESINGANSLLGCLGGFSINDEGIISRFLNVPVWQVYVAFMVAFISILLFLKLIQKKCFKKCFIYAFIFYFIIWLFEIKIY